MRTIADSGRPVVANRSFELVRAIYNWALQEELTENSPCVGLRRYTPEKPRERVLNSEEIRDIWAALDPERPQVAAYFKFLFYTGARKGEPLAAVWSHIDLDQGLWTLPQTKAGRTHILPLSSSAVDLLNSLGSSPDGYIFPREKTVERAKARLQNRSGVSFHLHDIRRSTATGLASIGVPDRVIAAILNHVPPGSAATRIYQRYQPLKEMRKALGRWAAHLERLVSGEKNDSKVIPIR